MADCMPPVRIELVWSPDLVLVTATEIDAALRSKFKVCDDEFVLNLIGKSNGSQILNRDSVALLEMFRLPKAPAEATALLARANGHEAETISAGASALINHWRKTGVFVDAARSHVTRTVVPASRTRLGSYHIRALVRSSVATDLYQAEDSEGRSAAVKIAASGQEEAASPMLDRELLALRRLAEIGAPGVIDRGFIDGRPFLSRAWISGIELGAAARRLRMNPGDSRPGLLDLSRRAAQAYAAIHRAGIVHGDVHPGNALVCDNGDVRLLDFGLATFADGALRDLPVRRGFDVYLEPECAVALSHGDREPPATVKGEVFALGALLYFLLTGESYLDFAADRPLVLRQIATEEPRPFSALGLAPWPEVERALSKALNKVPSARYSSADELADALSAIPCPSLGGTSTRRIDEILCTLADPRHVSLRAPSASVAYGAAGIAYVFRRAACVLERPDLLGSAELWMDRAWKETGGSTGLVSSLYRIDDVVASPASLYYGLAGIHLVATLVGYTGGDARSFEPSVRYLAGLPVTEGSSLEAVSGIAGALCGAALLVDLRPPAGACDMGDLIAAGQRFSDHLSQKLATSSPVVGAGQLQFLGAAHGWAGVLHAVVRWHRSIGIALPTWASEKLDELAALSILSGGVAGWRISQADGRSLGGWCHGTAGYVALWSAAATALQNDGFTSLALRSAEQVWRTPERSVSQLCCGLVGQAQALLCAYRLTGEQGWIDRAAQLADWLRPTTEPWSPLRGGLDAVLLDLDLMAPATSGMPLFDPERI
jgi:serine/threonine protein kinase